MSQISPVVLYSIMIGMLLTGTANTLVLKYMDETVSLGEKFTHPYLQCLIMFTGELSCLGLFGLKPLYFNQKKAKGDQLMLSPGG